MFPSILTSFTVYGGYMARHDSRAFVNYLMQAYQGIVSGT